MMIMRRSADYADLVKKLKSHKVCIWTCDTCARLCNGIGGRAAATELMDSLRADGVDVTGVLSTSAGCIMSKLTDKWDSKELEDCDLILALTCDVGSICAEAVFQKECYNPIETLGPGYLDENRVPMLADGRVVLMGCDPFI